MNRADIRSAVFNRSDADPSPTQSAVDQLDDLINQAIPQVALEAPFLFYNSFVKFATQPDVEPADATDTIQLAADVGVEALVSPWVFRTTLEVGSGTEWMDDRSWDGRLIYIYDDNGVAHENQIRSIWREFIGEEEFYLFTVMRPWPIARYGDGPFTWKVFTKEYFLYDDVVNIHSARITGATPHPIHVISQDDAERAAIVDHETIAGSTGGTPTVMFRRSHFQLPAPNTAPEEGDQDPEFPARWRGPEPPGTFQYCFTLAWGKRDIDYQSPGISYYDTGVQAWANADANGISDTELFGLNRMREPLWESAPSPVSEVMTVGAPEEVEQEWVAPEAVKLLFPNIEYMLGMYLVGDYALPPDIVDFQRRVTSNSGWHLRIYRRRLTENFTDYNRFGDSLQGASVDTLRKLDIKDDYFLIAEMRIDQFNDSTWIDNGTILPDYLRPLRDIHGYQGVRLHPTPDARYEVELRYTQRPKPLTNDQDVPQIHAEAMMLLVDYTLHLYMEKLHEPQKSAMALAKYRDGLKTLRKRYGDLRPQEQPTSRRPARVMRYNPYATRWWRRSS